MRLIVLLFVVITLFPPNGQEYNRPNQHRNETKDKEKAATPPSSAVAGAIENPASAEKKAPAKEESKDVWQKVFPPESWPNWGLFLAAIITAGIALKTLGTIREQSAHTEIAAKAAAKSSETAELTLRVAQRADILLQMVNLSKGSDPSHGDAQVTLYFKNFGNTRAYRVRFELKLIVAGKPWPSDNSDLPVVTIGAGDGFPLKTPPFANFLKPEIINGIMSNGVQLRFESSCAYMDAFGIPHTAIHCGEWIASSQSFRVTSAETD